MSAVWWSISLINKNLFLRRYLSFISTVVKTENATREFKQYLEEILLDIIWTETTKLEMNFTRDFNGDFLHVTGSQVK